MEKITGNEPAMPELKCNLTHENHLSEVWLEGGLTIRQHFAAMAMQGMVSNPEIQKLTSVTIQGVAIEAVQYADALIAELNKPNPNAKD